MKFEEKLIKLRKEKALSQEELGEKLNVTRQTISKWELGQSKPDMDKMKDMSNLFGVSLEELTNDEIELKEKKIKNDENKRIIIIVLIIVASLIVLGMIIKVVFVGKIFNYVMNGSDTVQGLFNETYDMMKDQTNNMPDESSTKDLYNKGIGIFNDTLDLIQDQINEEKKKNQDKKESNNIETNEIIENNIVNEQNNNLDNVANQVQKMQEYVTNQSFNF